MAEIVEYVANNKPVKMSADMVRKYLVSGGGNVTDQEVLMFMSLCKYQELNPFLKEAYLIKYGSNPAQIVVGKDVYTKRAESDPNYKGKQAGITVLTVNKQVIEREGSMVYPGETLIGGWCKVYLKDHDVPEYAAVSFDEYVGRKSNGEINGQWKSKPATMIRKVAIVQALREAFPEKLQGLYDSVEMDHLIKPDVNEEVKEEIIENSGKVEFEDVEEAETTDPDAGPFTE